MAQVLTKGDSVYECDVCARRVRMPRNDKGLTVIQRCVITANCKGKLHPILNKQVINKTPAFPPEVVGVKDWIQRRILFTFNQTIRSTIWTVRHDLSSNPIVEVYVNRTVNGVTTQERITPHSITIVDTNTVEIQFLSAESGTAQCIALASKNTINEVATTIAPSSEPDRQITNQGDITIAFLSSITPKSIFVTYNSPISALPINIEYPVTTTSGQSSILSAWAGSSGNVIINSKLYKLYRFNFIDTPPAPLYFQAGNIADSSTIFFPNISIPGQSIIMLANSPYAAADRVYDKYIDIASVDKVTPQLYYNAGNVYAQTSVIKSVYPPIIVVP